MSHTISFVLQIGLIEEMVHETIGVTLDEDSATSPDLEQSEIDRIITEATTDQRTGRAPALSAAAPRSVSVDVPSAAASASTVSRRPAGERSAAPGDGHGQRRRSDEVLVAS